MKYSRAPWRRRLRGVFPCDRAVRDSPRSDTFRWTLFERGCDWVVSDRSVYSSLAYQGGGRQLGIDAVRSVNEPGLEGVWPQLVILLRVDAIAGLGRQRIADRIGREGVEFQQRVADAFDELAIAEPDRFAVIDAGRPLGDVVTAALREIGERW